MSWFAPALARITDVTPSLLPSLAGKPEVCSATAIAPAKELSMNLELKIRSRHVALTTDSSQIWTWKSDGNVLRANPWNLLNLGPFL
jgi:hypothetical protein